MDRDEAVHHRHRLVVPVIGGVERERQAVLFEQRIGAHVVVVMHRAVARRRHHEADHARLAGELLHHAERGGRIVERQIEHRADARLAREHALDQPAVIGARERDLHLDLRMEPELEHRRGKDHRDVGAHRIHPAPRQRDVAMLVARHLFELAHRIAQHAPADVLIADAAGQHAGALRAAALRGAARKLLQHRIVHVVENLVERFELVVMRVDVDDRELVVAARAAPAARRASAAWWYRIPRSPSCGNRRAECRPLFLPSRPRLPHAELEQLHVHGLQDRGRRDDRVCRGNPGIRGNAGSGASLAATRSA